jgi:hypothetical protein
VSTQQAPDDRPKLLPIQAATHRRWYWKLYLILMVALTVGGLGLSFYYWHESSNIDRVAEALAVPMYIVQLAGLFGFVYALRIGSELLWKWVFAAAVLEQVWAGYEMTMTMADSAGDDSLLVLGVIVAATGVVVLPMLVALYIYGFRSPAIWRTQP